MSDCYREGGCTSGGIKWGSTLYIVVSQSWLLLLTLLLIGHNQCLTSNRNDGPPIFPGNYGPTGQEIIENQQAIFTTHKFECCGNVTMWAVDVHPGFLPSRTGIDLYSIDFQIWRPSPTVNTSDGTGCYSLVGNNRFTSITDIVQPGVVIVTPSPVDYVQFQSGDVVGLYMEKALNSTSGEGAVMLTTSDFTSEIVWLASIGQAQATSTRESCPYSVGINGVLNTSVFAAPVISIHTGELVV